MRLREMERTLSQPLTLFSNIGLQKEKKGRERKAIKNWPFSNKKKKKGGGRKAAGDKLLPRRLESTLPNPHLQSVVGFFPPFRLLSHFPTGGGEQKKKGEVDAV